MEEEKVRQWIIKELMDTYKYPKDLIDVEYKVNNFSTIGKVDVCISIYKSNQKKSSVSLQPFSGSTPGE
ncbi:type I restriction enzyme HsdR N-terminal domain-containing protein [Haloimpatiens lingqiaonensis]|uniref:type I restriction enzyme HsdR N-terminal domain-containing protein n=1 Tax=Haloimpatiens lingqiaonensis TaxID=1380675 RepID=UPI0010FE4F10|nr:type I restriction enzyme HsdR N-terminal domain-containing protein [Haloimpatiens lingqiaonensis]